MTAARPAAWFPDDRTFVSPDTYDAFFAVIERLESVLDDETAALAGRRHDGLGEFTRRKRQGFLELDRLMRAMEKAIPNQEILARLAQFKRKLEANDAMLAVHLRAAQAVTALIVRVMRDCESDGTYSRAHGRIDHHSGRDDGYGRMDRDWA